MNKNNKALEKESRENPEHAFLRQQQQAIATLAETFLLGEKSKKLYEIISEVVRDVLQAEAALVMERPPGHEEFKLYSACGLCDLNRFESTEWLDNHQFRATLQTAEVIMVPDYRDSSHYSPPVRECFKNFRAGMSVRIPGNFGSRGFLAVYHSEPRTFTDDEKGFLYTVSNMLAGALARDAKERELKESEARSKAILDTAVDGIVTIDENGTITLFNQAASEMFGYRVDEVVGRNVNILMPQPYRDEHDSYLNHYKSTGKKKIIGVGREMTGQKKDGSTFPLYLAVSEFEIEGKRKFTGIVRDISEQRRLEQEVLRISDHERRRIGQDLHDGLGQMLTGIGLMSQGLEKKLENEDSQYVDQVKEVTQLIREADHYAKKLSRGLLPVDFEVRGLITSLERLVSNVERLFDVTCTFTEKNAPVFYDNSVVEHLFRIAQEAISNAVKHGLAGNIHIELESNEEFASLRVIDDGKGFAGDWKEKKGSGIDIMRFRAQLIGASLDIRNMEKGGVALICILPKNEAMYRTGELSE